jgi:peroxiredoxin Q/BCP
MLPLAYWNIWSNLLSPQYPVLSDEQHVAQNAFQVGMIFFGLSNSRTTFVIDKDGTIR